MTKVDKKRKVRVNRDAVVVEYEVVAPEVIAPEVIAPEIVAPEVVALEPEPEEVSEQPLEELSIEPDLTKLMDESSCVGDYDPTSPANSPKRKSRKPSAPKPLVNEKNEYLNPRTNRYVKCGTTAFKQLVKDGVIVIEESITV